MARELLEVHDAYSIMNLLAANDGTKALTLVLPSDFRASDVFSIKDFISMDRSILEGISVTTSSDFTIAVAVVMAQWDIRDRCIFRGNRLSIEGFETLVVGDATDQDISLDEQAVNFERVAALFSDLIEMPMDELMVKLDSRTPTYMEYDELKNRNVIGGMFHETFC